MKTQADYQNARDRIETATTVLGNIDKYLTTLRAVEPREDVWLLGFEKYHIFLRDEGDGLGNIPCAKRFAAGDRLPVVRNRAGEWADAVRLDRAIAGAIEGQEKARAFVLNHLEEARADLWAVEDYWRECQS